MASLLIAFKILTIICIGTSFLTVIGMIYLGNEQQMRTIRKRVRHTIMYTAYATVILELICFAANIVMVVSPDIVSTNFNIIACILLMLSLVKIPMFRMVGYKNKKKQMTNLINYDNIINRVYGHPKPIRKIGLISNTSFNPN